MAEMRRPMDFWKGLVRPFHYLSNAKCDATRILTGVGANSCLYYLRAIRLLHLRASFGAF